MTGARDVADPAPRVSMRPRLPVDCTGRVEACTVRAFIRDDTGLVTITLAQNEVGALMPIVAPADLAHETGALLHTDAAQAGIRIGEGDLAERRTISE